MFSANASQVSSDSLYIEDVFSTYLYDGNGYPQTISNGIALANGAANGTVLQLPDSLTDVAPAPSTVINVNNGVSVVSSPVKFGSGSFRFQSASNGWIRAVLGRRVYVYEPFCIEFWQNGSATDEMAYVCGSLTGTTNQWQLKTSNGAMRFWIGGSTYFTASLPTTNQWNHIAFTSDGTTLRLFYNGSQVGSVATSTLVSGGVRLLDPTPQLTFGAGADGGSRMDGYMDDIRVTVGRSVYTSTFTPPSAALPLDTLVAGYGGMVWSKSRSSAVSHTLFDTARGAYYSIATNSAGAQFYYSDSLSAFNSDGFTIKNNNAASGANVSWTFRKAKKFFDIVTYTGNGVARTIAHNLGSVPGVMIVKNLSDGTSDWAVYHRSLGPSKYLILNSAAAEQNAAGGGATDKWNVTAPTSTVFSVGENNYETNLTGNNYVAYLFAHDAGGFGDSGLDSAIKCGSFTTNASGGSGQIDLGWEPQFLLIKRTAGGTGNWMLIDNMRGVTATGNGGVGLYANLANADDNSRSVNINSTGFSVSGDFGTSSTSVYIAIRRGPMRTPTSGTQVFSPILASNTTGTKLTTSFPVDTQFSTTTAVGFPRYVIDRLRGVETSSTQLSTPVLYANLTNAEATNTAYTDYWDSTGYRIPGTWDSYSTVYWNLRRAPGFFDVVCYTGTGAARTVAHNLGVAPELMIVKCRAGYNWAVFCSHQVSANNKYLFLDTTNASATASNIWNSTLPTSSVFSIGTSVFVNDVFGYVAYLFASVAGVSKVGSYTGTGTTQQINCGFTSGARFVLIKRTDTTGDWYVWDTARGITTSSDPYLLINASAAQVTGTDYIDPYSAGFEISSSAPAAINANGGTFIYLAIA